MTPSWGSSSWSSDPLTSARSVLGWIRQYGSTPQCPVLESPGRIRRREKQFQTLKGYMELVFSYRPANKGKAAMEWICILTSISIIKWPLRPVSPSSLFSLALSEVKSASVPGSLRCRHGANVTVICRGSQLRFEIWSKRLRYLNDILRTSRKR